MSDWQSTNLAKVLTLQRGHDLPARDRTPGSVPIIGSFGITGTHGTAKYRGPGVAIGRSGASIGVATYCKSDYWPLNTCLFVKDFRGNDPRWIYYLLKSIDFTAYNSGSAQPSLNRNYLTNIEVLLPPLSEQLAIAELLGALDDKIDSNRRMTDLLDTLALAECSLLGTRSSVRRKLGDLAAITLGGTPSKKVDSYWLNGSIPWINSGALHERPVITPTALITQAGFDRSATKLAKKNSTILAITGATLGVVSRLGIDTAINQSVIAVSTNRPQLNDYLYLWLRVNIADLVRSATGAAQQHVNKSNVEELEIDLPDPLPSESMELVSNYLEKSLSLALESRALARLRDTILPELLSGRLATLAASVFVET